MESFINVFNEKWLRQSTKISRVFVFTVLLASQDLFESANGLDWNDKKWKDLGCPNNILGDWLSRDGKNSISFENHRIIHNVNLKTPENHLIDIDLKPVNPEGEGLAFIKVRPHLAFSRGEPGASECLIKVFRFKSQKDAKFDKYLSWDIYKILN